MYSTRTLRGMEMSTHKYEKTLTGSKLAEECEAVAAMFKECDWRLRGNSSTFYSEAYFARSRPEHKWSVAVWVSEERVTVFIDDGRYNSLRTAIVGAPVSFFAPFINGAERKVQ
jgi:hypothetical protein